MQEVYRMTRRVARSPASVLLLGESGTAMAALNGGNLFVGGDAADNQFEISGVAADAVIVHQQRYQENWKLIPRQGRRKD